MPSQGIFFGNSYQEWRNFQITPNNHYGFAFSCIRVLHLRQLHLSLNMPYFISLTPKYLNLQPRTVRLLSTTLTSKRLAENWFRNWRQTVKKDILMLRSRKFHRQPQYFASVCKQIFHKFLKTRSSSHDTLSKICNASVSANSHHPAI